MINQCAPRSGPVSGGVIVIPSGELLWTSINFRAELMNGCTVSNPSKAAVSLFMWASGALFDQILNAFTNDPAPIIPTPGNGLNFSWTSANISAHK